MSMSADQYLGSRHIVLPGWGWLIVATLACSSEERLFTAPLPAPPPPQSDTRAATPAPLGPAPATPAPPVASITPLPPPDPAPTPPPSASPPATSPPATPSDVAVPPPEPEPACRSFGPFGPPEPITGLGLDLDSFGPVFSADGRTLFFSAIDGDEDIYSAVREPLAAQFSLSTPVPNLDLESSEEGTPFLSFDGLSLYFFSTRADAEAPGGRDIWIAQRPSLDAPFGEPAVLPAVNSPGLDHLPRLSRDDLSLLFVSGRDSPNEGSNLWVARRTSAGADFSAPVEVSGINTNAREEGFSLSEDGLTLFFASNRLNEAEMDLFVATRADTEASFDAPEPLVDLNSPEQDLDPQLSPDGLELFFASSRGGVVQLFRALRECQAR